MVSRDEVFVSKFLKVTDLGGQPAIATIKVATLENIKGFDGKEQPKVVCYFAKHLKPLILNRTNFDAIADIAGSAETNDWPGATIEVYPIGLLVNGKATDCIRVRAPSPGKLAVPAPKQKPTASTKLPPFDDSIPL